MKWPLTLLVCLQLIGCGLLSRTELAPTLSDLEPVRLPAAGSGLPSVSLTALEEIYRQVLAVTPDPETRLQVLHRLADIEMSRAEGELVLADGGRAAPLFEQAVESYRALLAANPGAPANDQLLYQLSKAYDLGGSSDESLIALEQLSLAYPDSIHFAEAEFRVAESYFTAGQYSRAEAAYRRVIEQGDDTAYYQNAVYMYAWAQFKQGHYRSAIAAFSNILDLLLPADNEMDALGPGRFNSALDGHRAGCYSRPRYPNPRVGAGTRRPARGNCCCTAC